MTVYFLFSGGFCEFHKLSPQLCEGQSHSFQTTQSLTPDQRVDWVTVRLYIY